MPITANTRFRVIVGSMRFHRLRRWPNIEPSMARSVMFAAWVRCRPIPVYTGKTKNWGNFVASKMAVR